LYSLFLLLLLYAAITADLYFVKQNNQQLLYQNLIRKSWDDNPDKHPHRMAHFGSFALRLKNPLSIFDYGLDNYAGNAIFLEAHKQNSVNYSEASFSTGLLRLGELSIAMLLQILLPLILFFLGYGSIAYDKENSTLKILIVQGVSKLQLLLGKSIGLWVISFLFWFPAFLITGFLLCIHESIFIRSDIILRLSSLIIIYVLFFWVVCVTAVIVSSKSKTSKNALIYLMGIWLFMGILVPRIVPVVITSIYPSTDKLTFESTIEKDIIKQGDSHNPNDPYFKNVKDSVLRKYGVSKPDSLPVNLAGIVASVGEQISAETYNKHFKDLMQVYNSQIALNRQIGFINPFIMLKSISISFCGSGFKDYVHFQHQSEAYRYRLAQSMNALQTKHITNKKSSEGSHVFHVENDYFKQFPDFKYTFLTFKDALKEELSVIIGLMFWTFSSIYLLVIASKSLKVINE
jgi:ABC-2 type transport system permease protein